MPHPGPALLPIATQQAKRDLRPHLRNGVQLAAQLEHLLLSREPRRPLLVQLGSGLHMEHHGRPQAPSAQPVLQAACSAHAALEDAAHAACCRLQHLVGSCAQGAQPCAANLLCAQLPVGSSSHPNGEQACRTTWNSSIGTHQVGCLLRLDHLGAHALDHTLQLSHLQGMRLDPAVSSAAWLAGGSRSSAGPCRDREQQQPAVHASIKLQQARPQGPRHAA